MGFGTTERHRRGISPALARSQRQHSYIYSLRGIDVPPPTPPLSISPPLSPPLLPFSSLFPFFPFQKTKKKEEQKPEPKPSPSPCVAIITRLAPTPPPFNISIHAYAQTQKDISGTSYYTAPVHAGVRLDIPLLDTRELYERQLRHIANLQNAQAILSQYLALRSEVEELKGFLNWMKIRVEFGIEYKRDVWQEEIVLKQKEGSLKALESFFFAYGITREELDRCYKHKGG
jgi:hypothetical protein